MSAVVAFALMGAAPLAFAVDDGSSDAQEVPEDIEAADTEDEDLAESAFKLGNVELSCASYQSEDPSTPELAMGVASERTYVITNEGERAYVRLASSLRYGELERVNDLGVRETTFQEPESDADGIDEGEEEESEGDDEPLARLASAEDASVTEGEEEGVTEPEDESEAIAWKLAEDGWWYRSEPLGAGESILVSVQVEIPFVDEWVQAMITGEPSSIEESFCVEGVQARNMAIDLTAADPWGDLEVEVRAPEAVAPDEPDSTSPDPETSDEDEEV